MIQIGRRFSNLISSSGKSYSTKTRKLGILGVECNYGQSKPGVSAGPNAIRNGGLLEVLKLKFHNDIKDYGNISTQSTSTNTNNSNEEKVVNMKQFNGFRNCALHTSAAVKEILNDERICLTLGGDHSIAVGTVHGHLLSEQENNVALLWVDAHPDINTNMTSNSGNIHGMVLSMLVKELSKYCSSLPLPGMEWLTTSISSKNIAYIGLRSIDFHEQLMIHKYGITAFGMQDIEKFGIENVVNMALEKIDPKCNRSLHVSFDIDSLDPTEAPSTGTPVRGGLNLQEGIHIMQTVRERGNLRALDLVEVNPWIGNKDDVKRTINAAIQIITSAFCERNIMEDKVKGILNQFQDQQIPMLKV